jgi:hypothetical protein
MGRHPMQRPAEVASVRACSISIRLEPCHASGQVPAVFAVQAVLIVLIVPFALVRTI